MPGTSATPHVNGGGSASAQPSVESWSVNATTSRPARAAEAITSAGVSVPSETLEWACRSILTCPA